MAPDATQVAFQTWWDSLKPYRDKLPARGTVAGALVVLQRLQDDFDLDIDAHTAKGGSQVKGAGPGAVTKILSRFGERRRFLAEAGRTNRGLRGDMAALLHSLERLRLERLTAEQRTGELQKLQALLVGKVQEFHNRERLKFDFNPSHTVSSHLSALLEVARTRGKADAVAQHLVGAKLQLRFPAMQIENHSYSTADAQLSREGDFRIGKTVFHVTIAPGDAVVGRSLESLSRGFKVYVLVPERRTQAAKQLCADKAPERVEIRSLEEFLSQNVDELAEFGDQRANFAALLRLYNERVGAVESDKSLLIELPPNLDSGR